MFEKGQVIVIDDFIGKDYQEYIKLKLMGGFDRNNDYQDSQFPWFYTEDVTGAGDDDSQHRAAFGHQYVDYEDKSPGHVVSQYNELFTPLLKKVGIKLKLYNINVLQGRSFLQFPILKKKGEPDTPHIDIHDRFHIVALYYVLDSDGDTIIYNERKESKEYTIKQKVSPKQGRIVIFDGGLYHTAEQPLNNTRCIVNYNIE
tara:strand:- start:435 stop:1037 length:603 start_codon:yes stop_codon:yes gene_type:complete